MKCLIVIVALFGAFFMPQKASAQGISSSVGGLEATPSSSGPESVFWNPASIGFISKTQLSAQLSLVGGWLIYDRSGTNPSTNKAYDSSSVEVLAPNPFFSIASPLNTEHFRFAYSTYFPAGALARFDEQGSQRYDLVNGLFIPWHHQLTAAFSPNNKWSLGASLIYSFANFETQLDIDTSLFFTTSIDGPENIREEKSTASRVHFPRSTTHSFGGSVGALYRPNIQWSFGASLYLPMAYRFTEDLNAYRPSLAEASPVSSKALGVERKSQMKTSIKLQTPPIFAAGFQYKPYGYWEGHYFGRYVMGSLSRFVSIDFQQSPFAAVDEKSIKGKKRGDSFLLGSVQKFKIWKNISIGGLASYHRHGVGDQLLAISRLDLNTLNVGLLANYNWSRRLGLGVEYLHSFMFDRQVDRSAPESQSKELEIVNDVPTTGRYRAGKDQLSVSVNYDF